MKKQIRNSTSKIPPLLWEVLFHRPLARLLILFTAFLSAVFGILTPLFQKEFIDGMMQKSSTQVEALLPWSGLIPHSNLYALIFGFAALLLAQFFSQITNYIGVNEAVVLQKIWGQRLYRKILSLRSDTLLQKPVGELVSIYATDVSAATVLLDQSIPVGTALLFPLILGPMAIYYLFKIPLFPLITIMVLNFSISFSMAYRQSKFFFNFKKLAGERIGLVNEWIQNIRTLRILSWVHAFEKKMHQKRVLETNNRILMVTNGQSMNAFSSSATFFINGTTLASVIYLSHREVSPGELLSLLWILGVFLTRPFRQMPWMFTFLFDAWTSLNRLQELFNIENKELQKRDHSENSNLLAEPLDAQDIHVKNLHLQIKGKTILENLSFDIKAQEFIAIVGEVGCGKTMLLLSLMGETGCTFENYQIGPLNAAQIPVKELKKYFSFIAQEGFIMNATLRDNVAFNYDTDTQHDSEVLKSLELAQFNPQNEKVTEGLDAEIGERGVNLSGGQKQRVCLARISYDKAPILLLDDCLSAVDVETENKLIHDLLHGYWKNRTRILVTHRLTVLDKVDRILFLENGQILALGTFKELMHSSVKFKEFIATIEKANEVEDELSNPGYQVPVSEDDDVR
jgi:ATP-binding cassette subfamily B multidrug efflux pump